MSTADFVLPSWGRWGQRCGLVLPQPEGRGPNGRAFCRGCGCEVPKGRQSWCGKCANAMVPYLNWGGCVQRVLRRDKVCQLCGAQHSGVKPGWRSYGREFKRYEWIGERPEWLHGCLEPEWRALEVDHILPIADGGTDDPANLRALCHTCHVSVTTAWRRRKSKPVAA